VADPAPGPDAVGDVPRAPRPPEGIKGAQWDELHRRWERWDESTGAWVAVTEGDGVPIDEENPLPPLLARELHHAEELPEREHVADVDRRPPPPARVKGAQWNEVNGRWERWDEATAAWVEAVDDA
jgi:hypothetical protein